MFTQGLLRGAARFRRLEGAWYGNGRIVFTSTTGGDAGKGQVWELDPLRDHLTLLFESPGAEVLDQPDNVAVSPRGGIVLCEDGSGDEYLYGLTPDGRLFRFCRNRVVLKGERNGLVGDYSSSELAGACWSPGGHWLFFNVHRPGISIAVLGPWRSGPL